SSLAEGKVVYCNARNLRVEAILRCILNHTGLDFVRTSAGTYVVIHALRGRARLGHLAGRVIDGTTGEPLPNANVLLADASVGTTTNEGGYFQFSSLISGKHRVLVTYVGYETAVDSVQILGGETMLAEIALEPGTLALETIVIDGLVERLPSRGLGAPALRGEGSPVAGTFGVADVAQTAAKVAGVSIRHPIAELHIQGSGAGDHLTLLDEVPVRDPVTLGRYLSAFSPLAIRRVRVHKAGYGAAFGGHLSGVVRIDHDVGAGERPDLALLIDPLSISGRLRGRFPIDDSRWADAMVSVRTAMWNMYRDPGLEELLDRWNAIDPILIGGWLGEKVTTYSVLARRHRPEVSFSDLHAAARMRLSPFRNLDLSAYRAGNRLASDLTALNSDGIGETNRVLMTQDDYEWTNWAAQVRHTWLVSARSAASLQVRGSHHTSMYRYLSDYRDVPLDA